MQKVTAAIVGSGNIGTDLLYKLLRSDLIEAKWMIGVDPESEGLKRASEMGVISSAEGVDWLLQQDPLPDLVFEATSASAHKANAPRYEAAGIQAIDMTPAAVGPAVVPVVNINEHLDAPNVSLITCGGQATTPIVAAISDVVGEVEYAEMVSSAASPSVGPGTRDNIDEFTRATSRGLEKIGGAKKGKAIIILNPADPPVMMRNTVFVQLPDDADEAAIKESINKRVAEIASYVPGYRLPAEPQFSEADPSLDRPRSVAVLIEVQGRGDFLPEYAGNLDIMTAAATRVGEKFAERIIEKRGA